MATTFEEDLQSEYKRIVTIDAEFGERLEREIGQTAKHDPLAAEQLQRQAKELSLDLAVQHDLYLSSGMLYRRAVCWAREYQSIIISQIAAKAHMRMAIEWLKVAVDLSLLVVTLGLTNLYRLLLPKLTLQTTVIRGVVPQSLWRTFLTGVPRTGYATVSRGVISETGRITSLLREGHIEKLIVFSGPLFLVKKVARKIVNECLPLAVGVEIGLSPQDMSAHVRTRIAELSIPEPAAKLLSFNEEQMMSLLAKTCVEYDKAIAQHAQLSKLSAGDQEYIKAVAMMDFWLNISRQIEPIYTAAREKLQNDAGQLRELREKAWHDNWKRRVH